MIKPRIKKGFNPQTGKAIIREEWPNICIYGLSDTEKEVLNKSLPHPNVTIEDVTERQGTVLCLSSGTVLIVANKLKGTRMIATA